MALLDHPTLAVAAVRKGRVRRANSCWNDLFAVRAGDNSEPGVVSLFPGMKSAERFERAVRAALDKGSAKVEHLLVRSDGAAFTAEVVIHLLAADNPLGADAVWQVRDISKEFDLRREIREIEEYYRALSTYQWDLTLVLDQDFRVSYASPSVEAALGYRSTELLGETLTNYLDPGDIHDALVNFQAVLEHEAGAENETFRYRVRHFDGGYRVMSCRLRNCMEMARIAGVVVNARDGTEEIRQQSQREERLLRASGMRDRLFSLATVPPGNFAERVNQILKVAVEALGIASSSFWRRVGSSFDFRCDYEYTPNGVPTILHQLFEEAHYPAYIHEALTRPIVIDDVQRSTLITAAHLENLLREGVTAMLDFPVTRDGVNVGFMCFHASAEVRQWDSEELSFAAGLSLLLTLALESEERAQAAAQTAYMALHDSLTGLANRTHAEQALFAAIRTSTERREHVAVMMIDLDRFKEFNDTYGHGRGDALLCCVADVLRACMADKGTVARMGGDEFLVIMPGSSQGMAVSMAQRMIDRLGAEQPLKGVDLHVGASIGIAVFPEDGGNAATLLTNADIAMYQAKQAGRNQHYSFNARLAQRLRVQRELDMEIRDALKRGEFSLFYQPQINLTTGQAVGLEALLRWEHPKRGLLLPSTFITSAERNGLLDGITKWALSTVCEQNLAWQRVGLPAIPISVNITASQFHDRHLPSIVASALMKSGLRARDLILEVTEESLIENSPATERVVAELRDLGVRIAIDDFGVGYSSLNYLRRLVVSQIKLDKAFVDGLPDDEQSSAIITAVITIAQQLGYEIVAEGVETSAQANHLRKLGCFAGQGFYFGAPLSAGEIEDFLREKRLEKK